MRFTWWERTVLRVRPVCDTAYLGEFICVKRSPAYQEAIHVGLRDEFRGVFRSHRTAIKNTYVIGYLRLERRFEIGTDRLCGILCGIRRSDHASADSPHRLVGDDQFGSLVLVQITGNVTHLTDREIKLNALTTLLEALPTHRIGRIPAASTART